MAAVRMLRQCGSFQLHGLLWLLSLCMIAKTNIVTEDTQPRQIRGNYLHQYATENEVQSAVENNFMIWLNELNNHQINHTECEVNPSNPSIVNNLRNIIDRGPKLVQFTLSFDNYTDNNPLLENLTWGYQTNTWSLVTSNHGYTMLSLAFNYGVLSLMTLSLGLQHLKMEIRDEPVGCFGRLNETEKINTMLHLIMNMIKDEGNMDRDYLLNQVCFQIIRPNQGKAHVVDRCCRRKSATSQDIICDYDVPNYWIHVLHILLSGLMIVVFIFGPSIIPNWMYDVNVEFVEYVVRLKEPMYKTMCIWRGDTSPDVLYKHQVDLRNVNGFNIAKKMTATLPATRIIPIKIAQFDIVINYRKLLPENHVPVSITECVSRALFLCKIRELEPFEDCCNANLMGCVTKGPQDRWLSVCSLFGRVLLVIILPFAYYIRVALYYVFEYHEMLYRHAAADNVNLTLDYNYRPLQYFSPTHPLFLASYTVYFITGFTLAYLSNNRRSSTVYQDILIGSFSDLKQLSMLKALSMVTRNMLWPLGKFGIFGFLVGLVYWPIALPFSLLVWAVYSLPLVFLTCRILVYTLSILCEKSQNDKVTKFHHSIKLFEINQIINKYQKYGLNAPCISEDSFNVKCTRLFFCLGLSFIQLLALYSTMLMLSEVLGFIAEVLCFTMMGIIINASKVLKYGALMFLVVIYSYDTYNNVSKKYLKLNKSLFSEIRYRMGKDIDDFTSLPSHLQGYRGFKAAEASQQADYETTDDLDQIEPLQWHINDLILFIDNEDNPRIPRKLFEDVCEIQTAGSPGPVYKSLLEATGKFLIIIMFIVFVFIVVMSFGEEHKVSSTNQMLATLAGGFIPLFFRRVLKPGGSYVDTGMVSFKSKLEEIIQNFSQSWPMFDFQFTVEEEPGDDSDDGEKKEPKTKDKNNKEREPRKSLKNTLDIKGWDDMDRSCSSIYRMMSEVNHQVKGIELEEAGGQFVDILLRAPDDNEIQTESSSDNDLVLDIMNIDANHSESTSHNLNVMFDI